jgi:phosphoribosylaminoimidazolecarboxamide formyltransferase/IMP cyclohydrolase
MMTITRALLSCSDKTGLEVFAKGLAALGVELVASGGTAQALRQHGLRVTSVEEFAGISEQLDGRVKTLHPKIHAGILAKRDDPAHVKAVGSEGLIDLVIVNLYPFEETIQRAGVTPAEAIEQIDIGGVALLRAAAKNFSHVLAVTDPAQYPDVLARLQQGNGQCSEEVSRRLATTAFRLVSAYDQALAGYLDSAPVRSEALPVQLTLRARVRLPLRYGENPHQRGGWYVPLGVAPQGLAGLVQRQGVELSYNNVLDVDAAVRCLLECKGHACVIVKHASLCGAAEATTMREAYVRAQACDAESAFGGIVGITRPLDAETATQMISTFLEVVIAPSVEPEAVAILAKKPKLRVVTLDVAQAGDTALQWRSVLGGWLVQEPDQASDDAAQTRVVTTTQPTAAQQRDLAWAWRVAKHVKSNAVVLAREGATVGIGQGQPSRVRAVRQALAQAGERAQGAVLASDGFFPFPDNVELAVQAGVAALIQPGGSIKDAEVIAAANQAKVAMVFTGVRHFKH